MEINLIKIEGKPIEKLLEVFCKVTGLEAAGIRKNANAKAEEILLIGKAKAEVKQLEANTINQRAELRVHTQKLNRQEAIEDVVRKTVKYLPKVVSDESVDIDWTRRFFKKAQDISNEEMKEIWAKILAGEIHKPGSFSLRTLETLSNITKNEAELFRVACAFTTENRYIFQFQEEWNPVNHQKLEYDDIFLLKETGLIREGNDFVLKEYLIDKITKQAKVKIGDNFILMSHKPPLNSDNLDINNIRFPVPNKGSIELPYLELTTVGRELCKLIGVPLSKEYYKALIKDFRNSGFIVDEINVS